MSRFWTFYKNEPKRVAYFTIISSQNESNTLNNQSIILDNILYISNLQLLNNNHVLIVSFRDMLFSF